MAWMDDLWHEVVGDASASLDWLKQVVLGEFDDHQSTSALIAQLLVSFVPGAVIVMSARDLTAVLIRMVRHPDKRESVTEWMILVACAIGLVPALVGAAAGAAAAGVGAVVGGLVGDEAGAALRATALLLIEDGARMLEKLIAFLRRFVKGDILRFLRAVKFAEYAEPVAKEVTKFIGHLTSIIEKVIAKASSFKWISRVGDLIEKLKVLETGLRDLDRMAARQVKAVMGEFDKRLARALGEKAVQADHVVHPNHPAPHPTPKPPTPKRVAARADHPLGKPPGLEAPDPLPAKTPPDKNLHPQGVEDEPSAAKAIRPRAHTPEELEKMGTVTRVRTAEEVNAEMVAAGKDPAWMPGTMVTTKEVPAGTRFNMVVDDEQAAKINSGVPAYGGWATNEEIPDQAFTRDKLAIQDQYKENPSNTVVLETNAPAEVNVGTVGPMNNYAKDGTYLGKLNGGVQQAQVVDRTKLSVVGAPVPLPVGGK